MSKYIELAKKLKALADRGVGGEKYNAKKMLKALLKKHNLTMEDIEEEEVCLNQISVIKEQRKLFHQIGYNVIGKKYYTIDVRRYKNIMLIECTKAHAIEIEAKLNFYWKAYKEELDIFYHAFIQKNKIFAEDADVKPVKKEDKEKMERMLAMASTIKKSSFHKLLEKK